MNPFDRLFAVMVKPWVVIGYLVLIILLIVYLDKPVAYFFQGVNLGNTMPILNWFTKLGLGALYFVPLFILALFFRYIHRNKTWEANAWFLWLCALIPGVICVVLKIILGRARPDLLFSEGFYGFYGLNTHASFWSFPSGHTSTIMGVVFGLSVLIPRYGYAFIALGLAIATSRILLTKHYLSDVLIASYLALLEVGLLRYWLRCKKMLINSDNYTHST